MAQKMTRQQRNRRIYVEGGIILVLMLILVITLYVLLDRSGKKEVNLNEITHLTLTGFNGEGEIEATVDVLLGYEAFFNTVEVSFSKATGLTNGDEIDITYSYNKNLAKAYNLRVISTGQHLTVRGLVDPVSLSKDDFFEGVDVVYEGVSPLVTASVQVDNSFSEFVDYEIVNAKEYYGIGEQIEVRAVYDEVTLADRDYVAQIDSKLCVKEFTVEDVDRYVTDTEDITDDIMASLKKEALSFFKDANEYGMRIFCDAGLMPVYIDKKTTFVWNSPSYISSYLSVLREECYGETGTHVNEVKLCYESVISQADGKACRAEVVVRFSDIIIRRDGTVDLNLESGGIISADRRDSHIKAIVQNTMDDDYETVKLK